MLNESYKSIKNGFGYSFWSVPTLHRHNRGVTNGITAFDVRVSRYMLRQEMY